MKKDSKIYIAGHTGMVGSAIQRNLESKGFSNFVFTPYPDYDLTDQKTVYDFFKKEKPEYIIDAAAKVGGILANDTYRAQFIYENLMIQNNIIHNAYLHGAKKLLFLGSSCIYPKNCPQPMKEEYLLTGSLEPTNEPYAIAKIAGIKMCEAYRNQYNCNFISVMPTNLYGPNDNFNLDTSHVLPAMIRKLHIAKCLENNDWHGIRKDLKKHPIEGVSENGSQEEISEVFSKYGIKMQSSSLTRSIVVNFWGTGTPKREFLYVEDMAEACVYLMNTYDKNDFLNIGCGKDISISELALFIKKLIDYKGKIKFDDTKPDGTSRKLLDISNLYATGWRPIISLEDGIMSVYKSNFLN